MSFPQLKAAIDEYGTVLEEFKKSHEARLVTLQESSEQRIAALQDRVEELESRKMNPGRTGAPGRDATWRVLKTQQGIELPFLTREQKAADFYARQQRSEDDKADSFDLGEFARGALLGSKENKAASGVMTVPVAVGSRIIDNVRALTSLARAGAGTIMIQGPTNLARVSGDATIYAHTEGAADISESDITLAAVTLNPKTLAALVPLTVELVQDSPNLDAALQAAMAGAFAVKLDALGIAKILADAAIAKSGSAHDPATWTGTMAAITAALAVNQDLPGAHIGTPANFMARASLLASTAGSWLGKPPALAGMLELFTSAMTTDVAAFGDFAAGFAVAMRADLTLEVVRHAKPTSASHLLVAHMRADGVVLQPGRLFVQKKVP